MAPTEEGPRLTPRAQQLTSKLGLQEEGTDLGAEVAWGLARSRGQLERAAAEHKRGPTQG